MRRTLFALIPLLLIITGSLWSAPVTYAFSGELVLSYAGQDTVAGTFTLDSTSHAVTDFSFTTPGELINTTTYNALTPLSDGSTPNNPIVYFILERQIDPAGFGFVLAFPGTVNTFSGGPLFNGPIGGMIRAFYSRYDCGAACGPTGYSSHFQSGSASIASSAAPEPANLAVAGGCLLLLMSGFWFKKKEQ